jgi:hypothetical protein
MTAIVGGASSQEPERNANNGNHTLTGRLCPQVILMLFKMKHVAFHFRTVTHVRNFNFPAESTFSGFGIDLA